MTKPVIEFPARLVEADSSVGHLLRQAFEEPTSFPSESATWHGLVEKREQPKRPLFRVFMTAAAVGAVGTFCLIWLVRREHGSDRVTAYADPQMTAATASSSSVLPGLVGANRSTASGVKPTRATTTKTEAKSPQIELAGPASAGPVDSESDTSTCARLAREGKLEQAASCYDQIARGSSMAAELALYEKARLESRALGRGAAALSTLDEHARRFPQGVLSTEAGLTRIELLARLGRANEALDSIERALGGAIGKERGGDLHALRGDILSSRGDCRAALAAYASARTAGIHPSRLKAGEQRCAALGDTQDSSSNPNP